MKYEKRRREAFLQANLAKRKHNPSRQSGKPGSINNQKILTPISSLSGSDEEQRLFRVRNKTNNHIRYLLCFYNRLTKVDLLLERVDNKIPNKALQKPAN